MTADTTRLDQDLDLDLIDGYLDAGITLPRALLLLRAGIHPLDVSTTDTSQTRSTR